MEDKDPRAKRIFETTLTDDLYIFEDMQKQHDKASIIEGIKLFLTYRSRFICIGLFGRSWW